MGDLFTVEEYTKDKLKKVFEETSTISLNVDYKSHFEYLYGYIDNFKCKTMVIEEEYIDRDYLEDFAMYYVRCFNNYERKCRRVHFFACEFDPESFQDILRGVNPTLSEKLVKEYVGFIVLKRLPQTIIGRTCLKHYTEELGRCFRIVDNYTANLFGLELTVKSLPFQEQDSVVSACATSSLWTAFHMTGRIFQHSIPSPSTITKHASEFISYGIDDKREFPNHGLSIEQMAYAVKKNSLEPLIFSFESSFVLKSCIYGYLSSSIPIILLFKLYDNTEKISLGLHAVTITGYSMGEITNYDTTQKETVLQSSHIDKIYVHDDQIGPFARMEFSEQVILDEYGREYSGPVLTTSCKDFEGKRGNIFCLPSAVLIPIYHKIRIPFQFIYENKVKSFIAFVCLIAEFLSSEQKLLWHIKLETINNFKSRIFKSENLEEEKRIDALTKPLPHYLWVVSCFLGDETLMEIVFDATDIEQANSLILVVEYQKENISTIKRTLAYTKEILDFNMDMETEIFDYFRK